MSSPSSPVPSISAQAETDTSNPIRTMIHSKVGHTLGKGTEYRKWSNVKVEASLSVDATPLPILLDTGAATSKVTRTFLEAQAPNSVIQTSNPSFKVSGMTGGVWELKEYAVCDVHLVGTKDGHAVTSVLRCELHIVERTSMFGTLNLGNDVIGPEKISLDVSNNVAVIGSTGASIRLYPDRIWAQRKLREKRAADQKAAEQKDTEDLLARIRKLI